MARNHVAAHSSFLALQRGRRVRHKPLNTYRGAVLAGYNKTTLVTAGKLKSLDGVYGLRFAHNTDVTVTGLTMTKN